MEREIKDENIVVGKMLQQARESRKVLQSELCDACGLTKNHISAVERGVSQASIKMLLGYCKNRWFFIYKFENEYWLRYTFIII